MSTNYYFKINAGLKTNDNVNANLQEYLLNQIDNEIHIGMRSAGWLPLFMKTEFYSSVKEIKSFYKKNKDFLIIVNEYDEKLEWKDLERELIDWNKEYVNPKLRTFQGLYFDEESYQFSLHEFS